MSEVKNRDFIFAYCERWDSPLRTSKHHLARHFAKANRVLYIEGPWHLLRAFKHPAEFAGEVKRWAAGPQEIEPNLWVMTAPGVLPFHAASRFLSSLAVNRVNQRVAVTSVARAAERLGWKRPIVWVYYGTLVSEIDALRPACVVAHVVDEWSAFRGVPRVYAELERKLLERANLTVFTSQRLFEEKARFAQNSHLVRHGADLGLFSSARVNGGPVPEELDRLPRPRIGYYGALHKIDLDLVAYCATERPTWSFVLIGPLRGAQGARMARLNGLPNVHLLGPRSQAELPSFVRGFDAAMLPFKVDELTLAMAPIKIYELLATGCPIVSVDLPETRLFEDVITVSRSAGDFVEGLSKAIHDRSDDAERRRTERVAGTDWSVRIREIESLLTEALSKVAIN